MDDPSLSEQVLVDLARLVGAMADSADEEAALLEQLVSGHKTYVGALRALLTGEAIPPEPNPGEGGDISRRIHDHTARPMNRVFIAFLGALWLLAPLASTASAGGGWYLMAPPTLGQTPFPDESRPLAEWRTVGSYDSAAECEQDRTDRQRAVLTAMKGLPVDPLSLLSIEYEFTTLAQCISVADSRLRR